MYQVYIDDALMYDPRIDDLKINSAKLDLELNKSGSFTFTFYPANPHYNSVHKLKSRVVVKQDKRTIYKGRPLNEAVGFYKAKTIQCEGILAFLTDSIARPFSYDGEAAPLFEQLIADHNEQVTEAQRLKLGNITVAGEVKFNAENLEHMTTLDAVKTLLQEPLGGYLFIRYEDDGDYIDWLADFEQVGEQQITFGKNLLDLKQEAHGEDIFTAILPTGEDEEGNALSIEQYTGGKDYIQDDELVDQYGFILKIVNFENAKSAVFLYLDAAEYLTDYKARIQHQITVTAADLANMDQTIETFRLGTYIGVDSKPHGLQDYMLVQKISLDLFNPAANKLTLGRSFSTFLDEQTNQQQKINKAFKIVHAVTQTSQQVNTLADRVETAENEILEIKEKGGDPEVIEELTLRVETAENGILNLNNTKANKSTSTDTIMAAANWSGNVYSFETTYPADQYDLYIQLSADCTDEQLQAWSAALILGKAGSNTATAKGTIPTIDIPISLEVVEK